MPITKKQFEVTALSEEGKEFVIEERLFIFNQPITHKIHTKEGGFPFIDYFSAKKFKEKLQNKENSYIFAQREGMICLTLVIIGLCLIVYNVFI